MAGTYQNEQIAWISLGSDNYNYRTINERGEVLTEQPLINPSK